MNCWRREGTFWAVGIGRTAAVSIRSFNSAVSVQLVFGPGEVLLVLRQILPVLAVLHGRGVVHGDVNPAICCAGTVMACRCCWTSVWCRPMGTILCLVPHRVMPHAQGRQDACAAWMDLHGLGVTALVLLTGQAPESLIAADAVTGPGRKGLDLDNDFRAALERLLSEDPQHRFAAAE